MMHIDHANLGRFDLNLLVALDALLTERNVTRAAARVGLGQSAMSHNLGRLRTLGSPIKMSATPPVADRRAPLLGEHTRETLREAGCTESEIRALMLECGLAV